MQQHTATHTADRSGPRPARIAVIAGSVCLAAAALWLGAWAAGIAPLAPAGTSVGSALRYPGALAVFGCMVAAFGAWLTEEDIGQ